METTNLKLWHISQWALCLGVDGALKIKLWEQQIGGCMTRSLWPAFITDLLVSKLKNAPQTETEEPVLPVQSHRQRSSIEQWNGRRRPATFFITFKRRDAL